LNKREQQQPPELEYQAQLRLRDSTDRKILHRHTGTPVGRRLLGEKGPFESGFDSDEVTNPSDFLGWWCRGGSETGSIQGLYG
jgi:hypothetical protein